MTAKILWEVTGRSPLGGIAVREGKDLESREEATRLGTGSIIRQIRLEGDCLQYERISGMGPVTGWVNLTVNGQAVVTRTVRQSRMMPVCMCFYTTLTKSQGRSQLHNWINLAKKEGLMDFVIGDQVGEEGYTDCMDFDDYTTRLASQVDEDPNNHGRPVFIVAHGGGAVPAWGTAKKLGRRCQKLYVIASRAPNAMLFDEVFNVDSAAKLQALDSRELFNSAFEAWPTRMLQDIIGDTSTPELGPRALAVSKLIRQQYGSSVTPYGSKDNHLICGGDKIISAPIMALAAEKENPHKGETPQKMMEWKSFTQRPSSFKMVVVPGVDHFGIMWTSSPAFGSILGDMAQQLASKAWLQKEARWASCAFIQSSY